MARPRKQRPFQFEPKKIEIYKYTLVSDVSKPEEIEEEGDPPMQAINGHMPDSIEEWRLAVALWRLGIPFIYQYRITGPPL